MCAIGNGDVNNNPNFIRDKALTYTPISFQSNAKPGGYTAQAGRGHAINSRGAPG